jgi:rubrerythrin
MRVRPFRTSTDSRRSAQERRQHRPAPRREDAESPVEQPVAPELSAEARLRASGGPDDQAAYQCSCGYVFAADVSTSVSCPHCGTNQAW